MAREKLNYNNISTFADTITVFNYNSETREYLSSSEEYLAVGVGIPANSCTDAPPEQREGYAICRTTDLAEWEYLVDHRGETVYSTETGKAVAITTPGEYPAQTTTLAPASPYSRWDGDKWIADTKAVDQAKAQVIRAIKAQRDTITVDYIIIDGNHFHSDANSRIQQLSLTRMGQAKQIPEGLMWQTKNNGLIALTNDIAAQFESVTMDHDMRLFANAQRHIAAVEALEDIEAVTGYDYSTGWQP